MKVNLALAAIWLQRSSHSFILLKHTNTFKNSKSTPERDKIYLLHSQPILQSHYECVKDWYANSSASFNLPLNKSTSNMRLAVFIQSQNDPNFQTMTAVKQSIRKGLILVNGVKVDNQYSIQQNDHIQYVVRSRVDTTAATSSYSSNANQTLINDDLECSVVWEDEYLAIVLKPQGLPMFNKVLTEADVHDDNDSDEGASLSLHSSIFKAMLKSSFRNGHIETSNSSFLQPLRRPRMVHRLDKGTGGLVVVAKTHPSLTALSNLFANREIQKTYVAMIVNEPASQGQINMPIDGKSALTDWRVIRKDFYDTDFSDVVVNDEQTMSSSYNCNSNSNRRTCICTIELYPHTGRKHQIRR